MTATYTNQPGTRDIDTVRMLIDDRDTIPATDAQLSDEEIQWFLDNHNHIYLAAAAAAEGVAAKYATDVNAKTVGDLGIVYFGQRVKQYKDLAKSLRSQAAKRATPYAGGLTKSEKRTFRKDSDRVQPGVRRGMHDNPGAVDGEVLNWVNTT